MFNGRELIFDVPPQLINGRTMVPVPEILEELGAAVEWEDETHTAMAVREEIVIKIQVDNHVITVNGKNITLDVPPQIADGRMLVPVRAIAEGLGTNVKWDEEQQKVVITTV